MSHDDFAFEPIRGLPERPPEGERILWQGRPDSLALARDALNLNWVAGYFVLLATWNFGTTVDQQGVGTAFAAASPYLILGTVVCVLLWLVAFVQARATVYTLTNRRVAMRIGAALALTLNIPFSQIRNADLALRRNGTGTIALETLGDTRLSFLVCWPHARPWRIKKTQPALRSIPDAARIADLLAETAEARISTPRIQRIPAAVAAE